MSNQARLTAKDLREQLAYEPATGIFRWTRQVAGIKAGAIAGTVTCDGYVRIKIKGDSYPAHHLAWLYVRGAWPDDQLDHRNRVRSNNRIKNLRNATNGENSQNRSIASNNTSGHTGVSWHKPSQQLQVRIKLNGKCQWLGYFSSVQAAADARASAKARVHTFHSIEGLPA